MPDRLALQAELETLLGSRNVYYQPPESVKMSYPCIKFNRQAPAVRRADGIRYKKDNCWNLTVITTDPETDLGERLAEHFDKCEIDRYYVYDNLTHCALTLYY